MSAAAGERRKGERCVERSAGSVSVRRSSIGAAGSASHTSRPPQQPAAPPLVRVAVVPVGVVHRSNGAQGEG